jgi:hypothetical protein
VLERLVIQAKAKGIHVVDRRGRLGTCPRKIAIGVGEESPAAAPIGP